MALEVDLKPYNERLFNTDTFRGRLHMARYIWLKAEIERLGLHNISVIELGSYDGKAINFLNSPSRYVGYDANWENGLGIARENWKAFPQYSFVECTDPKNFNPSGEIFDISICQETLEHLREPNLTAYIKKLASSTDKYCFVTVPNEQGLFFLLKHIWKLVTQGENEKYTFKEVVYTTLGMVSKVEKGVDLHKGFNYADLKRQLSQYFDIISEGGLPYKWLPKSFCFNFYLLLQPKKN